MESLIGNAKYAQLLADASERLRVVGEQLQELRERRVKLKQNGIPVNNFTDEGVYVCEVSNVRGGSLKIKRKSVGAVVLVEKPKPYIVDVVPLYVPRKQTSRKKWTIYSSILGTFRYGALEGLVRIRYNDNSFYEGPFVDEDCVDHMGQSLTTARKSNHFGIFRLADGRTFEGHNVDNHFDISNLQTYYRVKFPNGEVYEGMFVDETFHGVGLYKFSDGSVYEGQWHRGSRFGHGQLRSAEGWNYEGFFDTNRRHRKGIIDFPDGSSYMGDWYYDKITGFGIYITALKDVYRGQVLDGKFHGQGHILYADGSTFTGIFKDGFRHGKGIFIEKEGTEYYGHFHNDLYHGEMVVKIIIPIEEQGQDNYEIRVGLYEMGKLVKWKSKFSNPIATKQFIHLFKTNRDMFDSVYSMLLAKHLPHLPEGIDANNKKVKNIIFRIRLEAGMLVGQDALNQAKRNIENILIPYNRKKDEIDALKREMQEVSTNMITIERDSQHLLAKYSHFMSRYEKGTSKVEQFWQDDPKQIRINFYKACRELYNYSTDDYFAFRNFRVVPLFVKKIVDAISYLLSMPDTWKDQIMLLSDSSSNGRAGDEEALRLSYHCKLAYWMTYGTSTGASVNAVITGDASATTKNDDKLYDPNRNIAKLKKKTLKYFEDDDESKVGLGYNVFDFIKMKDPEKLAQILADTRFRSDSYYIESTGVVGPVLVNWVKANFAYLTAAKAMHDIMNVAEEDKAAAFRFKAQYTKKQDELSEQIAVLNSLQHQMELCNEELEELQHSLVKAKDLLQFIAGRYQFEQNDSKADYYKLLEQKLEEKRDFFNVEVCIQGIVDKVVERHDREKYIKKIQAFGSGQPYVDEDEINLRQYFIVDWIREEVQAQQRSILESGRTLGYGFEPEATDVTQGYTMQLISLIADITIGKMNDRYNDLAAARSWISRKGKKIPCRFVYIYSWKIWEQEAISLRNSLAISAWENIFGDKVSCARAAVEARVNNRMSSIARAQGKVWAEHHKQDIAYAESDLAAEFLAMYENVKEASDAAMMIEQQTTIVDGQLYYDESAITPALRAQTMCFSKLYPDDMQAARDAYYVQFAQSFYDQYGLTSGTIAFQLLNGLPTQNGEDDLPYMEYAQHWRDFNIEAYEQAGDILIQEMSVEFAELYPLNTPMEAARMIVNERLHVYLQDEALLAAYTPNPKHMVHAYCYAMRNQGLVRASKETLHKNYQSDCNKFWQELLNQTAQFQKGSALSAVAGEDDRFVGFRDRLLSKYGFVYAFLSYRYDVLSKEIGDLRFVDPLDKVIHRVRPSQMRDVLYSREHNFLQQKFELEDELNEAIAKLSTWNSYFGWVQSST
ncbi:hypothetical protein EON65_02955 [archaeon]|nr:MAG: hypothetical protein EON65_02955 [archaeon]